MAKRYSGDVELRIAFLSKEKGHEGDQYEVSLTSPDHSYRARVRVRGAKGSSPDAYDRVAKVILEAALRREKHLPVERSGTSLVVRRVFQAPCPVAPAHARKGDLPS